VTASAAKKLTPLDAIQQRLMALHKRKIDLTLDRMLRILELLGHPERRMGPVIHVAGTNGKGSTVAYLRAILEAAGLSVHVFTSPHLVRINERYRLGRKGGGVLVSDADLVDALAHCEQLNGNEPITVFEMETAAAFHLFAQQPADVVLLEVGLGGRGDSTNVVDQPLATVITPVAMDHMEMLGDTLAKIAAEKAGIIKRGVPLISAMQEAEAEAVIEQRAKELRAPQHIGGQHWQVSVERGRLVFQDERGLLDLPPPRLFGRHQFDNAGLAIAALRAIDSLKIPVAAYETGVSKAEWPARMQRLSSGALVGLAPANSEVWLDGGHNPHCGQAVATALGDLEERVSRQLVVIVGMPSNKDAGGFLANFAGMTRHIIAVPIPDHENAYTPSALAEAGRHLGMRIETAPNVAEALRAISRLVYEMPPRILITGSLYLAGAVLRENGTFPS
jgi:dihydrofolate synthase / folylpolyglutamate synthase